MAESASKPATVHLTKKGLEKIHRMLCQESNMAFLNGNKMSCLVQETTSRCILVVPEGIPHIVRLDFSDYHNLSLKKLISSSFNEPVVLIKEW